MSVAWRARGAGSEGPGAAWPGELGLVWRTRPGERRLVGPARVAWFGGPGLETVVWRTWRARPGAVRRTRRDLAGPASSGWSGGPSERGLVWRTRPGERGVEDLARAVWWAWRGPAGPARGLEDPARGLAGPARGLEDPARSGGPGLESAVWRTRRGLGERGLVWRARPGDRGLAGLGRAAWSGGPGLESAAWRTRRGLVWWGPASAVWSGGPGLESVVWRARRAVWRTRRGLAGPASAAQPIWRRPRELAVGLACWPPPRSPRPALVRGGRPGWPVAAVVCRGSLPRCTAASLRVPGSAVGPGRQVERAEEEGKVDRRA